MQISILVCDNPSDELEARIVELIKTGRTMILSDSDLINKAKFDLTNKPEQVLKAITDFFLEPKA